MTDLERFISCMEYAGGAPRPNHELGTWKLTMAQWKQEAPQAVKDFTWGWFQGEKALGMDHREFAGVDCGYLPPFPVEVVRVTDEYEVKRNAKVFSEMIEGTERQHAERNRRAGKRARDNADAAVAATGHHGV